MNSAMYELLFDMYMDGDITEIYLKKADIILYEK